MLITAKKFDAATRPTVYYAKTNFTLEFEFPAGVLVAEKTYKLAIDTDLSRDTPAMLLASAVPIGNKLTFSCSSYTTRFYEQSKTKTSAIAQIYESEHETIVLDDKIGIRGRTDVDGVPPPPQSNYSTTAEMTAAIEAATAEFVTGPEMAEAINEAIGLGVDLIMEGVNNE